MSLHIEEQLRQEGVYVSTTSGFSMWPMLRDRRDRVILRAKGEERLKKWDLPLYHCPDGRYVLHRVIDVKDGYYVIRGDNTYAKEQIPEEWILGVVTEFYRGKRHVRTDSRSYRFYAALWQGIYPLRYALVRARGAAVRIKRRIFSKSK